MRHLLATAILLVSVIAITNAQQRQAILRGVKTIQIEPTIVSQPQKVKEDYAPTIVQDALRNALRDANFEVVEEPAPIRAHMVLDEFSSGSAAKRLVVGFGAGRSTVSARLVFQDADGKELVNVPIKVRGNLLFSSYQGGNNQRRQATAAFDQRLTEEIARLR
jgi:hypothetical protein